MLKWQLPVYLLRILLFLLPTVPVPRSWRVAECAHSLGGGHVFSTSVKRILRSPFVDQLRDADVAAIETEGGVEEETVVPPLDRLGRTPFAPRAQQHTKLGLIHIPQVQVHPSRAKHVVLPLRMFAAEPTIPGLTLTLLLLQLQQLLLLLPLPLPLQL